jgi:WD repeat-containing protein 35
LRSYDDVIPSKVIFSLLALASFQGQKFGTCSKAFVKLESLSGASEEETSQYEDLALEIFTRCVLTPYLPFYLAQKRPQN